MTETDSLLEGGYNGLFGEVVTEDTYRLKRLSFVPDVIFDIGANVGIFSRFARQLFQKAYIVAVEPHAENMAHLIRLTVNFETIPVHAGLGSAPLYRCAGAANGSGESYLSVSPGFPNGQLQKDERMTRTEIPAMTLGQLWTDYGRPGKKHLLKVDCEGAENSIWSDPQSMLALAQMDYIAMELHGYSLTGSEQAEMLAATEQGLKTLAMTHACERDGVHFWARKI